MIAERLGLRITERLRVLRDYGLLLLLLLVSAQLSHRGCCAARVLLCCCAAVLLCYCAAVMLSSSQAQGMLSPRCVPVQAVVRDLLVREHILRLGCRARPARCQGHESPRRARAGRCSPGGRPDSPGARRWDPAPIFRVGVWRLALALASGLPLERSEDQIPKAHMRLGFKVGALGFRGSLAYKVATGML